MEVLWGVLILIFSVYFILKLFHPQQKKNLPPGPLSPPFFGHLHLYFLKAPLHRSLKSLSDRYGPVFYLRFGSRPTLVVSSTSAAEQCFTQNDVAFADRPQTLSGEHLGYNYTVIGFAPYGDHWRNLRRLTTIQVFSTTSLQVNSAIRNEEVRFLAGKLFRESNGETRKINLNSLFTDLVFNMIMMLATGKRWSFLAHDIFGTSLSFQICDYIPMLKWFGFHGRSEKEIIKLWRKRDAVFQNLIDEARGDKTTIISTQTSTQLRKTVLEALLCLQKEEPEHYTDDILKGILLALFTAGTHTTSFTMEWMFSLLLNHPEVLQKARAEIDKNVEAGHLLEDSDLPKLVYLHCIINETLRLYPLGPLLVPHYSSQDCVIDGFDVPRGTTLLVNAWSIQRDPTLWDEPTKFKPERFLKADGRREGFKFIPFGRGRRQCPGAGLAVRSIALALGAFIQCFEWERVEGSELVDMSEAISGTTLYKKHPLEAIYRPRPSMTNLLSQL